MAYDEDEDLTTQVESYLKMKEVSDQDYFTLSLLQANRRDLHRLAIAQEVQQKYLDGLRIQIPILWSGAGVIIVGLLLLAFK